MHVEISLYSYTPLEFAVLKYIARGTRRQMLLLKVLLTIVYELKYVKKFCQLKDGRTTLFHKRRAYKIE